MRNFNVMLCYNLSRILIYTMKFRISLSFSISLNYFATTFRPHPCVSPIRFFWPDHFLAGFFYVCTIYLELSANVHVRSIDKLSKCQLKFHLFQSAFAV